MYSSALELLFMFQNVPKNFTRHSLDLLAQLCDLFVFLFYSKVFFSLKKPLKKKVLSSSVSLLAIQLHSQHISAY